MSCTVPTKINNLFSRLQNTKYNGDLQYHHHFSVAIRNNVAISPVMCNYNRAYVFGKIRGSIHAEMNSLNYILNSDKSVQYHTNHNSGLCDIEQSKGIQSKGIQSKGIQSKGIR